MARRILITGAGGFVGRHFAEAMRARGEAGSALLTARGACGADATVFRTATLDITDLAAVGAMIATEQPTHVVNLAGIASPQQAALAPGLAWQVHLHAVTNLADAILAAAPACTLVQIGTGLVYGATALSGRPLDETARLEPMDIYAASKAAGDLALGVYARRGLRVVRLRPFNHTGPGQSESFAVPGFAFQIARIEAGLAPPVIRVGNLSAERDFLDVDDVVSAYLATIERSDGLATGSILNVASGIARPISSVLAALIAMSRTTVSVETDPARLRPADIPYIVGDAGLARASLGWAPRVDFDTMLRRVLEDCRARVASDTKGA